MHIFQTEIERLHLVLGLTRLMALPGAVLESLFWL